MVSSSVWAAFNIGNNCRYMNDTIKRGYEIQVNVAAILIFLTFLWKTITDVKYLFTTPSYVVPKINVVVETEKMSPKYTELLDKLLDKIKTPSFEVSKIEVLLETQK